MSLDSPWLADWRKVPDEIDLTPQSRRAVDQAIRQTSQEWETKHAARYQADSEHRFAARDEKVVGAATEMSKRLAQIRRDVRAGRLTSSDARAEIRTMRGRYEQARQLHETLIGQEDQLAAFANLTPDEYQRQFMEKFPALVKDGAAPTLAGVVSQMTPPPSPGGGLASNPGFVPAGGAPSADDVPASLGRHVPASLGRH